MEIPGFKDKESSPLHVGQIVLYSDEKGVDCPAIVLAIIPATGGGKPAKEASADLAVFSTNPGLLTFKSAIAYGTDKGAYHFLKV